MSLLPINGLQSVDSFMLNSCIYNISKFVFDDTAPLTVTRAQVTLRRIARSHNIGMRCRILQGIKPLTLWDMAHFCRTSHEICVVLYHNYAEF